MNALQIAWKNIRQNPATSILGILLTAFGTGILCVLLLTSHQIEQQLGNNSRGIDLVVGAKGSPIQLILSSIYHMDNPTGNISLTEAQKLATNPMVRLAVPLSLGDNYKGHRIIGTDSTFLQLYGLELSEGRIWQADFEAAIGADVAQKHNLKIGDQLYGAHGLSSEGHTHDEHPYTITGIFKPAHHIADRLILTNLSSVWRMHGDHDDDDHDHAHDETHDHGEAHDHDHEHNHEHEHKHDHGNEPRLVKSIMGDIGSGEREITSMLIQYRNPAAIGMFPRLVNQQTAMQAASPAIESARLFSLLGIGIDSLQVLAYVIMLMAALSVFISLYNALKSRKYDLAIMRTLGASQGKLFGIVIAEGILLTFVGAMVGIVVGHIAIYLIGVSTGGTATLLQAMVLLPQEAWLVFIGVAIGFVASVIPAIKAYKTSISQTLSGN
ncbi:ABC transporter permease [Parapedobacter sp. ISTM3]|uniref:Putative ABC transport system permease protein n=1 Tax=Parapedobacter luteus TaxID=623280 RepID=A0A1T5AHM6_9SPHI|nr:MULTISPECIES: ABC transporter permease [Parapedobacter]MBK1441799.1 ABC transporter permease [Parapedobacter sp. ISTM3]SKB34474.1 putative ABC transport system permease protein [Parapedobacter luteus]